MNSLNLTKTAGLIAALLMTSNQASATSFDYYLLAASWQPGFCVSHSSKPECQTLAGTHAATNLDLHGLWPNSYDGDHPYYCGVAQSQINLDNAGNWCSMNNYGVSSSTLANLEYYMPGVKSCLDKHEWYKHGTCANASPDAYWNTVDGMIERLNASSFNSFIRNNIGKYVTRTQLLNAFSSSFGSGTTSAVALKCTKTNSISYLTEVWINVGQNSLNQFPARSSFVLDGSIAGTCPSTKIFIAKAV